MLKDITLRWLLNTVANSFTFPLLFALAVSASIGPWKPDIVYILVYMRTTGPIFYLNHYTSMMAIICSALYFSLKDTDRAFRTSAVIISGIVGVHEVAVELIMTPSNGYYFSLSYTLTWSIYICVGVLLATAEQRKKLLRLAIIVVIGIFIWASIVYVFHHSIYTIIPGPTIAPYVPGPMILDPTDNMAEVLSWVVPCISLFWLKWK